MTKRSFVIELVIGGIPIQIVHEDGGTTPLVHHQDQMPLGLSTQPRTTLGRICLNARGSPRNSVRDTFDKLGNGAAIRLVLREDTYSKRWFHASLR
jgi:hypothetical protein